MEKLIIAVSGFPGLYVYRDNQKKDDAWKKVADLVGVSGELQVTRALCK